MTETLKGRMIEDICFSGLVERLTMISLICGIAGEAKADLSKDDVLNLISEISVAALGALDFSGVSREEASRVRQYLLSGMSVRSEPNN